MDQRRGACHSLRPARVTGQVQRCEFQPVAGLLVHMWQHRTAHLFRHRVLRTEAWTLWPARRSASTTCLPRNPDAPVTTTTRFADDIVMGIEYAEKAHRSR